jgi:hypothetical protein
MSGALVEREQRALCRAGAVVPSTRAQSTTRSSSSTPRSRVVKRRVGLSTFLIASSTVKR